MASELKNSNYNMDSEKIVCVLGGTGFIGSWLVKKLLERGYTVRLAVRNPDDPKNSHLKSLEGADTRMTMFKTDLMDSESLSKVINGCEGVFHMACPLTDDPTQVMDPAIKGTANIIEASAAAHVKRLVVTSTFGTLYLNPNRKPHQIVDEECWSDPDYCKATKNWYCYAKTIGEKNAFEMAKEKGVDMVVVNPSLVIGASLQQAMNASIAHVYKYLSGSAKTYNNMVQAYVHVEDVADTHIFVYENPSASGRYLCSEGTVLHRAELIALLAEMFPQFPHPTNAGVLMKPSLELRGLRLLSENFKISGLRGSGLSESVSKTLWTALLQKASSKHRMIGTFPF